MAVVRDQLFSQKPPGSHFRFSRTGVQPSPGSSTIELPSAFAEYYTLVLIAMPGHQTQQKQKTTQYINKKVAIIHDNNTIEPYNNRGLGQKEIVGEKCHRTIQQ